VAEPPQEIRIVVRADHTRLRAGRGHPHQPPAGVDQSGQNDYQEQIRHKNLLAENIRAVGRLGPVSDRRSRSGLVVDVLLYVLARLLLVVVLTAVIFGVGHLVGVRDFPLVVALLFALVIALPLGIWMFAPLRRRATASIAVFDERRRKDREQLQARLRGEETASDDPPPAQ
jgi:hypothetical protein